MKRSYSADVTGWAAVILVLGGGALFLAWQIVLPVIGLLWIFGGLK